MKKTNEHRLNAPPVPLPVRRPQHDAVHSAPTTKTKTSPTLAFEKVSLNSGCSDWLTKFLQHVCALFVMAFLFWIGSIWGAVTAWGIAIGSWILAMCVLLIIGWLYPELTKL